MVAYFSPRGGASEGRFEGILSSATLCFTLSAAAAAAASKRAGRLRVMAGGGGRTTAAAEMGGFSTDVGTVITGMPFGGGIRPGGGGRRGYRSGAKDVERGLAPRMILDLVVLVVPHLEALGPFVDAEDAG